MSLLFKYDHIVDYFTRIEMHVKSIFVGDNFVTLCLNYSISNAFLIFNERFLFLMNVVLKCILLHLFNIVSYFFRKMLTVLPENKWVPLIVTFDSSPIRIFWVLPFCNLQIVVCQTLLSIVHKCISFNIFHDLTNHNRIQRQCAGSLKI